MLKCVCVCVVCVCVRKCHLFCLRDRATFSTGSPHLRKNLIQPHEWSIKVNLNPAWRASDVLPVVLCSPALDKAHSNSAHLCQLVHRLKAMVDRLSQHTGKVLVVEYLEAASWRDLADCSWMKPMGSVAVTTLDKYGTVAQAFSKHFPSHIKEVDTLSNVPPSVLNGRVTVYARQ